MWASRSITSTHFNNTTLIIAPVLMLYSGARQQGRATLQLPLGTRHPRDVSPTPSHPPTVISWSRRTQCGSLPRPHVSGGRTGVGICDASHSAPPLLEDSGAAASDGSRVEPVGTRPRLEQSGNFFEWRDQLRRWCWSRLPFDKQLITADRFKRLSTVPFHNGPRPRMPLFSPHWGKLLSLSSV